MIKFFIAFTLMLIAIVALCCTAFSVGTGYPLAALLLSQGINMLGCYALLGIGIGLPLLLLASVLGWGQLLLLMSGNIDPHLAKESFFDVIKTLFSKI